MKGKQNPTNVLIFVGYKVDGTSGELMIFNSKTATNIIVLIILIQLKFNQ